MASFIVSVCSVLHGSRCVCLLWVQHKVCAVPEQGKFQRERALQLSHQGAWGWHQTYAWLPVCLACARSACKCLGTLGDSLASCFVFLQQQVAVNLVLAEVLACAAQDSPLCLACWCFERHALLNMARF